MVLEINVFHAGDEPFSAGDEQLENAHSTFSHTHTNGYRRLPNKTYVKVIASHRCSPPMMGTIMLRRPKRYLHHVEAQYGCTKLVFKVK